jgi:integron integrase
LCDYIGIGELHASDPSRLAGTVRRAIEEKSIPVGLHGLHKKWLRYYLDICRKYHFPPARTQSLPRFVQKLREKKQTSAQQEQAANAIKLYYDILPAKNPSKPEPLIQPFDAQKNGASHHGERFSIREPSARTVQYKKGTAPVSRSLPTSAPVRNFPQADPSPEKKLADRVIGAPWKAEYARLVDEIKVRHYSPKTLQTYRGWVQHFQSFLRSKAPESLSANDVKEFLTSLAVKRKVSSTTQNQAFNALLFFYRHALKKEFGKIDGVVRAKRKPYIPVVLSREEIDVVLKHLEPPYDLVVKLLYGCGLRLFECLGLRVHCMNFDAGVLTVHDGKGQKDRTVPLPDSVLPELRRHLDSLKDLHRRDLARGYAGVFLVNALEQKYKNAAREFIWQWFFPAKQLTYENKAGEYRRYHLHGTHVQKGIKEAVSKSRIPKRATAHTFRHSFASHLLQANYDIRTIQELLGHSDVRTTMICTHTIRSRTLKEAKSPLDF